MVWLFLSFIQTAYAHITWVACAYLKIKHRSCLSTLCGEFSALLGFLFPQYYRHPQVKNGLEVKGTGYGDPGRKVARNLKSPPNQRARQRSNQKLASKNIGLVDVYDGLILRTGTVMLKKFTEAHNTERQGKEGS